MMRPMWRDEKPVAALGCQVVLDSCHLGRRVKHGVHLVQFMCCFLKTSAIVRVNGPWFFSSGDESSQCRQECICRETCDEFNMDSLDYEADKYGNETLGYLLAAWWAQSDGDRSCIVDTGGQKWSGWSNSKRW